MRATSRSRPRTALARTLFALSLLAGCSQRTPDPTPAAIPPPPPASALFAGRVQPVFESRCAVCHGCYDAPCQLDLGSYEGATRGATKQLVFDSSRLLAAEPTRLFVDEQSTAAWRARGFFPVLASEGGDALLLRMLAHGRAHVLPPEQKLPADLTLGTTRHNACPTPEEFDAYAAANPGGGMPYATAPLSDAELETISGWVRAGAPPPLPSPPLPAAIERQVARWEEFLDGDTDKERLVARYLYEHWFLAHLYFADFPNGPFFRVVRSRTPPGQPVDEIASRRPYDDPQVPRFWYRLREFEGTVLHKTHIVYRLDEARRARLTELFLTGAWQPTRMPGHGNDDASNPFVTFAEVPARARYQFMLDDAKFFVMNFIRGPVCYGQVAVDVIEDRFFVMYLDPDHDVSVLDPEFLPRVEHLLQLPADQGSRIALAERWIDSMVGQARYLDLRDEAYEKRDPQRLGPTLDWIWDGDGTNPNALQTVFRHFDSAAVLPGFVGDFPKTAWVMDYPIFERIYYDLVAGFDVFGNVPHQLATRLYMDHLRMQSENTFLSFLPADRRQAIRDSWYVGADKKLKVRLIDRLRGHDRGTQVRFETDDPARELLAQVLARSAVVAGPPDLLNRCPQADCLAGASPALGPADAALRRLANAEGGFVTTLPELSLLLLEGNGGEVYSLVRDVWHTNVAYLFGEDSRIVPERDRLTVVRGVAGSYPNFLFSVAPRQLDDFVSALLAVKTPEDLEAVVLRWGVRRSSPTFWTKMDAMQTEARRSEPVGAGLLDLNRYENL